MLLVGRLPDIALDRQTCGDRVGGDVGILDQDQTVRMLVCKVHRNL